tara:strand:+ start:50046 stop:53417 length:3372 start_codon:yes stop_codon:yes gene_type:complete
MRNFLLIILCFISFGVVAQNDSWLNLQIQFDNYPEELDWKLFQLDTLAPNNILVAEGGPYYSTPNQHLLNVFIPNLHSNETYILEVHDSFGDGLSWPNNGYVYLSNICTDTISYVEGDFGPFFTDTLTVSPCNSPPLGCPDTLALNYDSLAQYTDMSVCTYPPCTSGLDTLYVEPICDNGVSKLYWQWSDQTDTNPNCGIIGYYRGTDLNNLPFYPWPSNWPQGGLTTTINQTSQGQMHYFYAMLGDSTLTDTLSIMPIQCILGCTDPTAMNYNPWANEDDGNCQSAQGSCNYGETCVRVIVTPDSYGEETYWSLTDTITGTVLGSVNPGFYSTPGVPVTTNVCAPENSVLEFTLNDQYGDGMCGTCWGGIDGSVLVEACGDTIAHIGPPTPMDFGSDTTFVAVPAPVCTTTGPTVGCMDPGYVEYLPTATQQNPGDCVTPVQLGCVDPMAFNYDSTANQQLITPSCTYTLRLLDGAGDGWFGSWIGITQGDSIIGDFTMTQGDTLDIPIVLDAIKPAKIYFFTLGNSVSTASQCGVQLINPMGQVTFYAGSNPWTDPIIPFPFIYTTIQDCGNSCVPTIPGCMDSTAYNYNPGANVPDTVFPCFYNPGCISPAYLEYHTYLDSVGVAPDFLDPFSCQNLAIFGCMDSTQFNYDQYATVNWTSATDSSDPCVPMIYGCTDATALNYDPLANTENYTCILPIYGCTDSTAFNFNPLANTNNGTCIAVIEGCTDPTAMNYNPNANTDDFSCIAYIYGCTDSTMWNYNPLANTDNGTCEPFVYGCTDVIAANFDPLANTNNNTCYYNPGCTDPLYVEFYNQGFTADFDDGSCLTLVVYGCTDNTMFNYDPTANVDNGSCEPFVYGCIDSTMFNYDPLANTDNGTCVPFIYGCMDATMFNYDPLANTNQVSETDISNPCIPIIYGCTDSTAFNYDPYANTDNGTCEAVVYGCTDEYDFPAYLDSTYINYLPGFSTVTTYNVDVTANTDDGSCLYYDENSVTGPGTPYWLNDSCYAWVVYDVDPYCMTNQWDAFCQSQYDYCEFGTPIGLNEMTRDQVLIFPNPTNDLVTIRSKESVDVNIYDFLGNLIFELKSIQEEKVDLRPYSSGIYNIQLTYKGIIINHKVVKQ